MNKIALIVTLDYKPESKAPFLQALFDHRQRCLQSEPGTLQFEILSPGEGSDSVVLFELYADDSALRSHDEGSSLALFKQEAGAFIAKASGQRCTALQVQDSK